MRKETLILVTAVGALATAVGCSRHRPEPTPPAGDAGAAASLSSSAPAASAAPEDPQAMPAASIAAVVNPDGVPAYNGPTGSVEGTVLVKGPDSPDVPGVSAPLCPAALDTYGKLFRAGQARADGLRPLADAVVVVIGYEGRGYYIPEKDPAARVTVTPNCAYPTRTIAMTFGQWLEVSNDSKQPFGPYLEYVVGGAVRIAPPQQAGEPVKVYPPRAGHLSMRDRLQPYVHEDVWVFRHPLHAVTDLAGHFRIDGVPLGPLKVGAELTATGSKTTAEVDVRENVVQNVELVLTYEPKPVRAMTDGGRPGRHLSPND
jgi:hypothetical protein